MSQTLTDRVVGNRTGAGLKRWLVTGISALIVAAGLVALGRWTAPSTQHTTRASAPSAQVARDTPGTMAPTVMPPRALRRTLEHIYLGTPLAR